MSDVMLHGVLNMPIDCWDETELDKQQRHARYVEASKRIIELEQQVNELEDQRYTHVEVAMWLSAYRGKNREKTLTDWVMEYREQQKQKENK